MQPEAWQHLGDTTKTAQPVATTLIGIFIGSKLSRSAERRKWLNDSRKEEYRELMTALTNAILVLLLDYDPTGISQANLKPEDAKLSRETYSTCLRILKDRIFIADDLAKMKTFDRWTKSVQNLHFQKQYVAFEEVSEKILEELRKSAQHPL